MIDRKILSYFEFLNESKDLVDGIVMGSYTRLNGNGIKISSKNFNENAEEDNSLGLDILVEYDMCDISYLSKDKVKNIEIPMSAVEFFEDGSKPKEIKILKDSKWASDDNNMDMLYEFIEEYLTEYYDGQINSKRDPKLYCIDETEILLSECGNLETIKELEKFENTYHSFIGEDERYYKFKRKDSGPISSVEIYETRGNKIPQLKLKLGKINECKINISDNYYTISKNSLSEIKENFLFKSLMSSNKLKNTADVENSLLELLKAELKDNKGIENNIDFLSEILKTFSSDRDIEIFIRENSI